MDLGRIGNYIAQKRVEKRITQEKLAEKLGVSRTTVSKWERGTIAPDISMLLPLSEILGVDVNELLNGESKEKEKSQSDINTVDIILYYSNNYKKKYLKIIIIIALILCFTIATFFVIDYTKYDSNIINIEENGFYVSGYMFDSKVKDIIIIKNVQQNDQYIGTDKEIFVKEINFSLFSDGNVIYSSINSYNDVSLNDALKEFYVVVDNGSNIKPNNLYVQLDVKDTENNSHKYILDLD